jgi:hypothetical protein
MKFFAIAVAALMGMTEAAKLNTHQLNSRMKNDAVKRALMHGAQPYDEKTKRLLNDNQFEITGSYSVQFDSCFSMTVQNADVLNDVNLMEMAEAGTLISEKDYILFKVCATATCAYDEDDQKMTFVTDVGTYFQALSQYLPQKIQQYCEGCEQQYQYCYTTDFLGQTYYPEGYVAEEEVVEEEAAAEEGEGGRKLNGQQNQVIQFIDCAVCQQYECLDFYQEGYVAADGARRRKLEDAEVGEEAAAEDEAVAEEEAQPEGNGYYNDKGEWVEVDLDDAMEWLNSFSECVQTAGYLNEYPLYSSLMCNQDGDGIEIGLFLDDECLMYTTTVPYKDVMQDSDIMFYNMIEAVVEFTFTTDFECYNPEVVFYNPVDYEYQQANGEQQQQNQNQNENQNEPEAAEWCQQLMEHDGAVNLYDCNGYEARDGDGDGDNDDIISTYSWYAYEIAAEASENLQAVCLVLQGYEGEHHTSYNGNNGNLFDYKKGQTNSKSGLSGGAIAGIVLLVFVLVGAAAGAYLSHKKKGTSSGKKPLIDNEGTMA